VEIKEVNIEKSAQSFTANGPVATGAGRMEASHGK